MSQKDNTYGIPADRWEQVRGRARASMIATTIVIVADCLAFCIIGSPIEGIAVISGACLGIIGGGMLVMTVLEEVIEERDEALGRRDRDRPCDGDTAAAHGRDGHGPAGLIPLPRTDPSKPQRP